MVITILTAGTRGDTQPYIALGLELKKAGYKVRIATFENYKTSIEGYGLEFYPIRGDISMVTSSDSIQIGMKADNPFKVLLSFNKLKSLVFDLQEDFFNACLGSDAIVYHPGVPIGYFIAQYFKIPSILATPFPMTPTKDYPALIFYNIRLGKRFNFRTHKIFEKIMWFASRAPIKQYWKKKFGKFPKNFKNPFNKQKTKMLPTITSCSQHVFPKPDDWPEFAYNTGYWFLDQENDWKPSSELLDFLHKDKPPVYFGFGSIKDPSAAADTTELIVEALKISGKRGILATGWSGMTVSNNLSDEIFIIESAPHSWLFPQMAAVVHHGGAGTTAAGLRAGVPSIIIPHSNDQFAWGRRVYELGIGSKPIPRKKLNAKKLAEAIEAVLSNEIKDAAKLIGRKIARENGAESAAKIIASTLQEN